MSSSQRQQIPLDHRLEAPVSLTESNLLKDIKEKMDVPQTGAHLNLSGPVHTGQVKLTVRTSFSLLI